MMFEELVIWSDGGHRMTDNDGFQGGNHNALKEGGGMKRSRNSREKKGGDDGNVVRDFQESRY